MPESKRDVTSGSPVDGTKLRRSLSVFNNPIKDGRLYEKLKPKCDEKPLELDGPKGPEPTRYGDWERKGRCIDF